MPVRLDPAEQAHDLALVHEEPAGTERILVEDVALLIGRDMHLPDIELPVLDLAPGLLEAQRAETDGLDLSAGELDAGFEFFVDEIFMKGLLISCGDLHALRHRAHLLPANICGDIIRILYLSCQGLKP